MVLPSSGTLAAAVQLIQLSFLISRTNIMK